MRKTVAVAALALVGFFGWREHELGVKLDALAARASEPAACAAPRVQLVPVAPAAPRFADARRAADHPAVEPTRAAEAARPEPAAPTAEQAGARDAANQRLDAMQSRGRFDRDDVRDLHHQLDLTDGDGAREILQRMAVAINTGKLVPAEPRLAF